MTAGDHEQWEGGGDGRPHEQRTVQHGGNGFTDAAVSHVLSGFGLSGGDNGGVEFGFGRDVQGLPVEVRAAAPQCRIGQVADGLVDRREHRRIISKQGDADAPFGQAVYMVDIAFDGIHCPPFARWKRCCFLIVVYPLCGGAEGLQRRTETAERSLFVARASGKHVIPVSGTGIRRVNFEQARACFVNGFDDFCQKRCVVCRGHGINHDDDLSKSLSFNRYVDAIIGDI